MGDLKAQIGEEQAAKYGELIAETTIDFRGSARKLGWLAFSTMAIMSGLVFVTSIFLAWRTMFRRREPSGILEAAIKFTCRGGTSFEGAHLEATRFFESRLRNTSFARAHIDGCYWRRVKEREFAHGLVPKRLDPKRLVSAVDGASKAPYTQQQR